MRPARAEQSYSYACIRNSCHAVEETKTARAGKGREGRLAAIGIFQTSVRWRFDLVLHKLVRNSRILFGPSV